MASLQQADVVIIVVIFWHHGLQSRFATSCLVRSAEEHSVQFMAAWADRLGQSRAGRSRAGQGRARQGKVIPMVFWEGALAHMKEGGHEASCAYSRYFNFS
jgi:hypothetical protein